MDGSGIEKRKQPRVVARWQVEAMDLENHHYTGLSKDVSLSGIAVYFDVNLRAKQRFKIRVTASIKKKTVVMEFIVEVIHTVLESSLNKFCAGLRILSYEGDAKDVLSRYIISQK